MQSNKFKLPLSSAPRVLTDVCAVEQPAVSSSCLQSDETSKSNLDTVFAVEDRSACASMNGKVPATPVKGIYPIRNDDGLPTESDDIQSTPAKLALTPIRLMAATPALQPPKRCYMTPNDESTTSSVDKLARRPPRTRSLKFDTPVKNKNVEDEGPDVDGTPVDNDFDILSEDLLQSVCLS